MSNESPSILLTTAIKQAIADPISADLRQLLEELETSLSGLTIEVQLRVAGNLLAELAEICAARAEKLLADWEERYTPTQGEPILTAEMIQEVLRQTMSLNLDGLLENRESVAYPPRSTESVVGEVAKGNVLKFINTVEQEQAKQTALGVAHDENVSAWGQEIAQWMQLHSKQAVPLVELQAALKMPLVSLWLAVLLGGYPVEQRGEFYQIDSVWVSPIPLQ